MCQGRNGNAEIQHRAPVAIETSSYIAAVLVAARHEEDGQNARQVIAGPRWKCESAVQTEALRIYIAARVGVDANVCALAYDAAGARVLLELRLNFAAALASGLTENHFAGEAAANALGS